LPAAWAAAVRICDWIAIFVLRLAADAIALGHHFGGAAASACRCWGASPAARIGRLAHLAVCTIEMLSRPPPTQMSMLSTMICLAMRSRSTSGPTSTDGRSSGPNRHRQAGAQRDEAGDVAALRTLLQGGAHHHVVHFAALDPGALNRGTDREGASVAPVVLLKAPRAALVSGVRAVETMTASRDMGNSLLGLKVWAPPGRVQITRRTA
jgi:hypothetical protein